VKATACVCKILGTSLAYSYCLKKRAIDAFIPAPKFVKRSNAMKVTVMILLTVMACSVASVAQDHEVHQRHVATAAAALKTELAKNGKDCVQAHTQYEDTACTAQTAEAANRSLAIFFDNLNSILPKDAQSTLLETQKAWSDYRKKACDAIYEFYRDGSIRDSERARCEIQLTRQRMQDLDFLYYGPLHR
jgi:uncharacterized protein YecT (DUF1311 family)